jgi:hypothetical protein
VRRGEWSVISLPSFHPEDSDRKTELAEALSHFVGVCRELGRLTDAESYEREAAALRPKTGANPAEAAGTSRRSG